MMSGTQRITLDTAANSPILHKWNTRRLTFQPLLSFTPLVGTPANWLADKTPIYSALNNPLPVNLHLLTVQDNPLQGEGSMILRLDHSFEVGEDPVYSQPVTVNLFALFSHIYLDSCTEMTLTANQPLANVHRLVWNTSTEGGPRAPFERTAEEIAQSSNAFTVTVNPMEIRTWYGGGCGVMRSDSFCMLQAMLLPPRVASLLLCLRIFIFVEITLRAIIATCFFHHACRACSGCACRCRGGTCGVVQAPEPVQQAQLRPYVPLRLYIDFGPTFFVDRFLLFLVLECCDFKLQNTD